MSHSESLTSHESLRVTYYSQVTPSHSLLASNSESLTFSRVTPSCSLLTSRSPTHSYAAQRSATQPNARVTHELRTSHSPIHELPSAKRSATHESLRVTHYSRVTPSHSLLTSHSESVPSHESLRVVHCSRVAHLLMSYAAQRSATPRNAAQRTSYARVAPLLMS